MKRFLLVLAAVAVCSRADAFFFPDWPGSRRTPKPALVMSYTPGDPPSVTPPVPPKTTTNNPDDPNGVPEPSTMVLAAIGLGLLVKRWK